MTVWWAMNSALPVSDKPLYLNVGFSVKIKGIQVFEQLGFELSKLLTSFLKAGWQPYGDWNGLIRYCRELPMKMYRYLDMANKIVGLMYYHDVQAAWEAQKFVQLWSPLSGAYLAEKINQKLDRRTLIATGNALKSLGMRIDGKSLSIEVGVSEKSKTFAKRQSTAGEKPSRYRAKYMLIHEFGSKDGRIPARPLFGPTLDANLDRYVDTYVRFIDAAFLSKPLPAVVNA